MTPQNIAEFAHRLGFELPLVGFMAENDFFSRSDLKEASVTAEDVVKFAVAMHANMRDMRFPPGCESIRERMSFYLCDTFGTDLDKWARAVLAKAREELQQVAA